MSGAGSIVHRPSNAISHLSESRPSEAIPQREYRRNAPSPPARRSGCAGRSLVGRHLSQRLARNERACAFLIAPPIAGAARKAFRRQTGAARNCIEQPRVVRAHSPSDRLTIAGESQRPHGVRLIVEVAIAIHQPSFVRLRLGPGNDSGRQRKAIFRDRTGGGEPHAILVFVIHAMRNRLAQRTQAKRLPHHEAVERDRAYQRPAR